MDAGRGFLVPRRRTKDELSFTETGDASDSFPVWPGVDFTASFNLKTKTKSWHFFYVQDDHSMVGNSCRNTFFLLISLSIGKIFNLQYVN
jgi:hypothetical protein